MTDIDELLKNMVERRGSDLHLKVDRPPLMRISGDLVPTEFPVLTDESMDGVLKTILNEELYTKLLKTWEADAAYTIKGLARFRINCFRQMDHFGVIARFIRGSGCPGMSFRAHSNSFAASYSLPALRCSTPRLLCAGP